MNDHLRDRILRKLQGMSDERGYQVLDFVEFLEGRYVDKPVTTANPFTRFTEAVEDRLRAGRVSASAIAETVGLMNRAAGVLNSALETTRSITNEIVNASTAPPRPAAPPPPHATPPGTAPAGQAPAPQHQPDQPHGGAQSGAGHSAASPTPVTPPTPGEASSPAHGTAAPGSGEEKL
jgi:hypothetical protein